MTSEIVFRCSEEQLIAAAERMLGLRNVMVSDPDAAQGIIKALLRKAGNEVPLMSGTYEVISRVGCAFDDSGQIIVRLHEPSDVEKRSEFVKVAKGLQEVIFG